MRSTVDVHDSLDRQLRSRARALGITYKEALNRALASGLSALEDKAQYGEYRVEAKRCGFRPGIDTQHLNRIADELDDEQRLG